MDIRNWSLSQIMQLPDCVFGRHWWIGTYAGTTGGALRYWTIEEKLPNIFIVWQMLVSMTNWSASTGVNMTVRLAERGEDEDAFWNAERLFHQIRGGTMVYEFHFDVKTRFYLHGLRTMHEAQGHRICGALKNRNETANCEVMVAFLISALPTEVPDWLISGVDKSRL